MAAAMSVLSLAASIGPSAPLDVPEGHYEAGVCNIGPAEIAKRRRAGHVGALATAATFALLVAIHASPLVRLVVIGLFAAGTAACYLEAYMRFCGAFGIAGVFNFGRLGSTHKVVDKEARARDRRRVLQLVVYSVLIGLAVGLVAAVLPL